MTLTAEDLNAITTIVRNEVNEGISGLEEHVSGLEDRIGGLETRMDNVESDIKIIKVDLLENNIIPRLTHMEQCYLDASNRYINKSDEFDKNISRIDIIENVVTKHSEQIQELQLKQA